MAVGHFLFQDDKTSCGGVIIEGIPDHIHFGRLQACEDHSVTCGKHPGLFKIIGAYLKILFMAAVSLVRCTAKVLARAGLSLFHQYTPTPMNLLPNKAKASITSRYG